MSAHDPNDLDASVFAGHHSLGPRANQAAPGNHKHNGLSATGVGEVVGYDSGWITVGNAGAPAFQGTWVNYDPVGQVKAAFRRLNGVTYLRGLIKGGTLATAAFTLPVGFRPSADIRIAADSNGGHGLLYCTPDGKVTPYSGSNASYGLTGSFPADL